MSCNDLAVLQGPERTRSPHPYGLSSVLLLAWSLSVEYLILLHFSQGFLTQQHECFKGQEWRLQSLSRPGLLMNESEIAESVCEGACTQARMIYQRPGLAQSDTPSYLKLQLHPYFFLCYYPWLANYKFYTSRDICLFSFTDVSPLPRIEPTCARRFINIC